MYTTLITGANRGIGLELARQYAAAGWRVLACCRNPEKADALNKLAAQHGGQVQIHALEVTNLAQIDQLAKLLASEPIDLLINNAGYYPKSDKRGFDHVDYDEWMQAFKVNTMAPLKMAGTFVTNVARSKLKIMVTLSSKMPLLKASKILVSKRISGAPVVTGDRRVVGILSQSDVIGALKRPLTALKESEELGRKYKGVDESTMVKEALSFVSLDWLWYRWNMRAVDRIFKRLAESNAISELRVKDAMTSARVVSVGPDDPTESALRLMDANDINRLPVIDSKKRLVGSVARADLLKAVSKEMSKGEERW